MVTNQITVELKNITGKEIKQHPFFRNHSCEADIEYTWRWFFHEVFNDNGIESSKKKLCRFTNRSAIGPQTDGEVTFVIGNNNIFGLQETKYGSAASFTDLNLKKQLIQGLGYNYLSQMNDITRTYSFYILNSENYFVYVLAKDIQDLISDLNILFENYSGSPSELIKNSEIMSVIKNVNIPFKSFKLNDDFNLTDAVKDIIKECYNIDTKLDYSEVELDVPEKTEREKAIFQL